MLVIIVANPIKTDQGLIPIEKIQPGINTLYIITELKQLPKPFLLKNTWFVLKNIHLVTIIPTKKQL